jgi:hypothetical protein
MQKKSAIEGHSGNFERRFTHRVPEILPAVLYILQMLPKILRV